MIFHEYTHLLIEKTVGNVPHWFNEGLAEYYSTFTLNNGREVVIGKPIARHLRLLRQGGLLPLRTLLEVNQKSPYYNEREKQGLFYAQSWLLVHYLLVANDGRRAPMLEKFIREIATNVPLERAFEDSFEMKIETLEQELLTYIKRNRFQVTTQVLDDRLDVTAPVAEAEMKEAEVQAYLGDLLLHCNRSDSEDYLQRALSLDANQPIANASLAMLRVRQGKFDEARENLERAVKANSENYLVHYYYPFALSREGVDETKRISGWAPGVEARMRAELNRAIELRPDFPESYNLLVFVNLVCGVQLDQSVKLLRQVLQTSPGRNDLLFMLAQVYIRKQDFNQAREILDLLSRSKNDADIAQQAESIRARLPSEAELASRRAVNDSLAAATESEGPSAAIDPVARLRDALRKPNSDETQIQGTLRRIECDSTGIVFDIQLEDRLLRLWSERLEAVRFISFYAGATGHVTCGTFKSEPSVIVCYVPGSKRFDGTPKSIEFVPHEFRLKS